MRLYELFENHLTNFSINSVPTRKQLLNIVGLIRKNCKAYIHETNGNYFYRGLDINSYITLLDITKSRPPVLSSPLIHETFNHLIKINGRKANRSNSIFVTGNIDNANFYGNVYYIFPIGNFHYTWLQGVKDWYVRFDGNQGFSMYEPGIDVLNQYIEKYQNQFKSELEQYKDDYTNFINLTNKIHILARKEYKEHTLSNISSNSFDNINQNILNYFKENLKGDDGTLIEAYNSGNEVMISCDQYIAIRDFIFEEYLMDYIK